MTDGRTIRLKIIIIIIVMLLVWIWRYSGVFKFHSESEIKDGKCMIFFGTKLNFSIKSFLRVKILRAFITRHVRQPACWTALVLNSLEIVFCLKMSEKWKKNHFPPWFYFCLSVWSRLIFIWFKKVWNVEKDYYQSFFSDCVSVWNSLFKITQEQNVLESSFCFQMFEFLMQRID